MHRDILHYSEPCFWHLLCCDLFFYWSLQIRTITLDGYLCTHKSHYWWVFGVFSINGAHLDACIMSLTL